MQKLVEDLRRQQIIKSAKKKIDKGDHSEVWDSSPRTSTGDRLVMLTDAPTLHRPGIQGL